MRALLIRARDLAEASPLARLLLFLSVMGPGIITASVDNDAGGIATYSLAGAQFGYRLLWALPPIIASLIVVQEMCARMGVVTGKGLADLIREQYGVKITTLVMLALLVTNFANTMAEFSGLAVGGELFGVSRYISVPLGAAAVWVLVVGASYRAVERVFLVASAAYLAYVVSGLMAGPSWEQVGRAVITPQMEMRMDYVLMLMGLVGTTTAPWMQFYLQSAVVEKGLRSEEYPLTRLDAVVGCIVTGVIAFFIITACAATIHAAGLQVQSAEDAALALAPLAGRYASLLFAFGLVNASLFAASILPLSTAYAVCEALGFESGVNRTLRQAPIFFALYTLLIVAGAAAVLLPGAPLLAIMFLSQVANGVLLPVVLFCIIQIINDRRLMGKYANSLPFNLVAWLTTIVTALFTAALLGMQIREGLAGV